VLARCRNAGFSREIRDALLACPPAGSAGAVRVDLERATGELMIGDAIVARSRERWRHDYVRATDRPGAAQH
jgi:hypothetical protein